MEHRFCNVFSYRKRFFISIEKYARGPRLAVFPPKELAASIDDAELGSEVEAALAAYHDLGRAITANEWEALNKQLIEHFGELSVAALERKRRSVTVRDDSASGEMRLFGPRERLIVLNKPAADQVGRAVKDLLG